MIESRKAKRHKAHAQAIKTPPLVSRGQTAFFLLSFFPWLNTKGKSGLATQDYATTTVSHLHDGTV